MASTRTTENNIELMQTYYSNVFLERLKEKLVMARFADTKTVPLYSGKVIDMFRWLPIEGNSTPITEGTVNANQVDFEGQRVKATIVEYGNHGKYTTFLSLTGRDPNLKSLSELFAESAANIIDDLIMTEVIQRGSIPIRVDELTNDGTYTIEAAPDTTGSTTTFTDASLTETTANFWSGGHIGIIPRPAGSRQSKNYGWGGQVTAFNPGFDALTVSPAAEYAFDTVDTYRMVVGTGLTSSNKMTSSAISYGVTKLRVCRAPEFDGGYYHIVISPQVEGDLMADSVYQSLVREKQGDDTFYDGVIVRLWGARFFRTTAPYRETTAGVKSTTGDVYCTPLFGKHAFGRVALESMTEPTIILRVPGSQSTDQPYNTFMTIAWHVYMTAKALSSGFAVNLMSGASM